MDLQRTQAPSETIVDLATVKAHLRISHTAEDANLTRLIEVVDRFLDGRDGHLRRALVTQSWTLTLPWWPYTRNGPVGPGHCISLPLPPLQSAAVQYYDSSNVLQTLNPSQYVVVANEYVGRLEAAVNAVWPVTFDRRDAVKINFVAGYGAAVAVPAPIKQAALLMIADMHLHRSGSAGEPGPTEKRLLSQYRVAEFT